jgi:hypothetical protein
MYGSLVVVYHHFPTTSLQGVVGTRYCSLFLSFFSKHISSNGHNENLRKKKEEVKGKYQTTFHDIKCWYDI